MSFYRSQATTTVYCTRCQCEVAHYRAPLTSRQARLLAFIRDGIAANGFAPSFNEIARAFGYRSLATVHEHMHTLERKGYITRRYNEARAIELVGAA